MKYWWIRNRYKIKRQINFRNLIILLLLILSFLIGNTLGKAYGIAESKDTLTIPSPKTIEIPKIQIEENKKQDTKEKYMVYNIPLSPELQIYTYDLCSEYGLNYELVLSVMKLESNFNINAVSKNKKSTDLGLMQINNLYADFYADLAGLKKYDVFNPYDNIKMGIAGLAHYKRYWQNKGLEGEKLTKAMLLSYNRGINGAKKYIKKYGYDHAYTRIIFKNAENIVLNK